MSSVTKLLAVLAVIAPPVTPSAAMKLNMWHVRNVFKRGSRGSGAQYKITSQDHQSDGDDLSSTASAGYESETSTASAEAKQGTNDDAWYSYVDSEGNKIWTVAPYANPESGLPSFPISGGLSMASSKAGNARASSRQGKTHAAEGKTHAATQRFEDGWSTPAEAAQRKNIADSKRRKEQAEKARSLLKKAKGEFVNKIERELKALGGKDVQVQRAVVKRPGYLTDVEKIVLTPNFNQRQFLIGVDQNTFSVLRYLAQQVQNIEDNVNKLIRSYETETVIGRGNVKLNGNQKWDELKKELKTLKKHMKTAGSTLLR